MQYMTTEQKIEALGLIGEKYVANYLAENNRVVKHSLDKFDSRKDLLVDGTKTVEVKTGVPFISERAFSVHRSQLDKCRYVDELYFVTIPAFKFKSDLTGWLYSVEPKTFKCKTKKVPRGDGTFREMLLIPIEQDAVTRIHKIDDYAINEMMKYNTSKY